jgi:hypothetical protein
MAEEPIAATEVTPDTTGPAPETTEVQQPVSEDAQTPAKSADEKYQQTLTALREERQKRKQKDSELEELRERLARIESKEEEEPEEEEEAPKRYRQTKAEALSELAIKLVKDPGFKDRLDLVEEKMAMGMTLEAADNAVLADIARKMMSSPQGSSPQRVPNSINPTAIPEAPSKRPTGNVVEDAIAGRLNIPEEQRIAIMRLRESGRSGS